jgi:hypothetical protein
MPVKSAMSGAMWGQDVPYFPGSRVTQEYEQDQKNKKARKISMMKSNTHPETFQHRKAVEHSSSFVNFRLANKIHGMGAGRLRLF